MGSTNPFSLRSFSDLNELIDQKDSPGWSSHDVALKVDVIFVHNPSTAGSFGVKEYVKVSQIGAPRVNWIWPKRVTPAVVEGFRLALAYNNPALEHSPNGHVIRRIMFKPIKRGREKHAIAKGGLLTGVKQQEKLVIVCKYRIGRTKGGVIARERLVLLSDIHHVLALPESRIGQAIELLLRAYHNPPAPHALNIDRFHHVGTIR